MGLEPTRPKATAFEAVVSTNSNHGSILIILNLSDMITIAIKCKQHLLVIDYKSFLTLIVLETGLEPACLIAADFKSAAYTNSATPA